MPTASAWMLSPPCSIAIIPRSEGEWIPNQYGGRENLEAISFLRQMNETLYREYPDVHTIAEESTAWPMVSRPTYIGGLGFGMQVGHGLDARHAGVHESGSVFPQVPSQQADVSHDVRVLRRTSSCRSRMMKWCMAKGR